MGRCPPLREGLGASFATTGQVNSKWRLMPGIHTPAGHPTLGFFKDKTAMRLVTVPLHPFSLVQPTLRRLPWNASRLRHAQLSCYSSLRRRPAHDQESFQVQTSTTTSDQPPMDFFRYTSGRWLWNEEQELRDRYTPFNVPELQLVAAKSVDATSCVAMTKLGEGSFNKSFRLVMDNGSVVIAKIPHPIAGPKYYTTASEVATMDFVRSHHFKWPHMLLANNKL